MTRSPQRAPTLYGIVTFKLIRGLILLVLAQKVFSLVGQELRPHFDAAVHRLRLDPETEFFDRLGDRIDAITPLNVGWAATGTLLYGALSLSEAVGLAMRARWAGLLVVVESGFFIPLEVYGLIRNPSATIVVVLIFNLAILIYLHRNRNRLFRHG